MIGLLSQIVVVILFFAGWHLFSLSDMAHRASMPGPIEVFARLFGMLVTGEYWLSVGSTTLSWLLSLLMCIVIGVPFGLLIGRSMKLDWSVKFLIDFLRTIPSLALIPLVLLLLGPSNAMVVVVSFLAAVWPLLIQSIYAGKGLDPVLFQVSRSFRLRMRDRIRFVLAPDVLAFVWPGLRLAVTASLLVTVGAELIGGAPGIGSAIQQALLFNQQDTMFAFVVTSALFGLIVNFLLLGLQRRLLWWHPSMRGGRS